MFVSFHGVPMFCADFAHASNFLGRVQNGTFCQELLSSANHRDSRVEVFVRLIVRLSSGVILLISTMGPPFVQSLVDVLVHEGWIMDDSG